MVPAVASYITHHRRVSPRRHRGLRSSHHGKNVWYDHHRRCQLGGFERDRVTVNRRSLQWPRVPVPWTSLLGGTDGSPLEEPGRDLQTQCVLAEDLKTILMLALPKSFELWDVVTTANIGSGTIAAVAPAPELQSSTPYLLQFVCSQQKHGSRLQVDATIL